MKSRPAHACKPQCLRLGAVPRATRSAAQLELEVGLGRFAQRAKAGLAGQVRGFLPLGGLGRLLLAYLVASAFADAEDLLGPAQRLFQGAAVPLLGFHAGIVRNLREVLKGNSGSPILQAGRTSLPSG